MIQTKTTRNHRFKNRNTLNINSNKKKNHRNSGFSLIELIVTITILAIISAFFVSSMIHYVEESRADKDTTTMSDITKSIESALTDSYIYNTVLGYATYGNKSCYISKEKEILVEGTKIEYESATTEHKEQYAFGDAARKSNDDGTTFFAAGNMYGATITFQIKDGKCKLKNAIVNLFAGNTTNSCIVRTPKYATPLMVQDSYSYHSSIDWDTVGTLDTMDAKKAILNKLLLSFSDEIELSSHQYKNSDYTVFISLPSPALTDTMTSGIQVYGQFDR